MLTNTLKKESNNLLKPSFVSDIHVYFQTNKSSKETTLTKSLTTHKPFITVVILEIIPICYSRDFLFFLRIF
jgi:hypothetical protein